MAHGLHDLGRHNSWATAQVLTYCQGLDEATLKSTVPGTFGTINELLHHIVNSEASYLFRVAESWPALPWTFDETVGLDALTERAEMLAAAWEQFLDGEIDFERLGEGHGDNGDVFAVRAGIFITQAIHHANEHRAHICTILGAQGHEPPEVSAWGYSIETGRSWLKT